MTNESKLPFIPHAGTPMGTSITVHHDGSASVSGIDYGPGVKVHSVNRSTLILKTAGHSSWSGIGQRRYVSPRFLIYTVEGTQEDGTKRFYKVTPAAEISLARGADKS
jgi:hypothetical protein